jgi:phosphatidylinositol 4-phosphatase
LKFQIIQVKISELLNDFKQIGLVYGFVGKYKLSNNSISKLIFIKQCECVGHIRIKSEEHAVFKIKEILTIGINDNNNNESNSTNLDTNDISVDYNETIESQLLASNLSFLPSSASSTSLNTNFYIEDLNEASMGTALDTAANTSRIVSKLKNRIDDEIKKIFQENNGSFYYSPTYDLTNSVERQQTIYERENKKSINDWRLTDDRFFWNKILLNDFLNINFNNKMDKQIDEESLRDHFVLPLVQGFFQVEVFDNKIPSAQYSDQDQNHPNHNDMIVELKICLISRRSRYRLGTRFKRRGIDKDGNVANFVETEQIIDVYGGHTLSFVIIRGSIPLYWSQPGMKYRPTPILDKSKWFYFKLYKCNMLS